MILFYVFAAMSVISALFIFFTKNVLHAAVALLVVFLSVAGVFAISGAEFLSIVQIVVYVGGVLIILMFGVMLSSRTDLDHKIETSGFAYFYGVLVLLGLAIGLIYSLFLEKQGLFTADQSLVKVEDLGESLMTTYVFPFELIAVILLIALIAAMHIAARKESDG